MKRREFVTLLGGAAVAVPVAARAQQGAARPVVGFLHSGARASFERNLPVFLEGLAAGGFAEGRDVAIEYRWAEGRFEQLPALVNELIEQRVTVIAAFAPPAAAAAKAATTKIPVVFLSGVDPMKAGLVTSLNRPGGNVTGFYNFGADLGPKQIGILSELVPAPALIGALINPGNPDAAIEATQIQDAATAINRQIVRVNADTVAAIDAAFAALAERHVAALYVGTGTFYLDRRSQIAALAENYRIPAIYPFREDAVAGGLMSYGINLSEGWRQAGIYTARILKGEKPADLPVMQSTKFEFVINTRAAKTIGVSFPPSLIIRADEVLE
jgi:putative ABC transport system substrate-binding protein